ncbi:hypothetical protein [Glycomyces harbinensis]|uniref:DUF4352 domain-containing protein n=1 Tax=Glycomyces harbinensis TaxID=58114 RepID=A0A1G6WZX6_9ACTN|nr:hypothetical protein [Glycomyces harbinensis]SDD70586.1 hypothetical protein SAMN05216270_106261 [Glycomyces harbinensis]
MSARSIAALAAALLLTLTGCADSGGADTDSGESTSQEESSPSTSGPTYTAFADFPGEELLYVEQGVVPVGLRLKAVDTVWQTELAGQIADADAHYLVVYVAVTGEADDRGVADAWFNYFDFELVFPAGGDACAAANVDAYGNCTPNPVTSIESVADGEWRDHMWGSADAFGRVDLPAGATMIGGLAFQIPDAAELSGDMEFCASGRDVTREDNCITVPAPAEPWG